MRNSMGSHKSGEIHDDFGKINDSVIIEEEDL